MSQLTNPVKGRQAEVEQPQKQQPRNPGSNPCLCFGHLPFHLFFTSVEPATIHASLPVTASKSPSLQSGRR